MSDTVGTIRSKFFLPFLWLVTGAGSLAFLYSVSQLSYHDFDSRFAILAGMALLLASQITVPIPRFSSQISVSDTFVFLLLLLYGGPSAVTVGAIEAVISSRRFSKKPLTIAFNFGCSAVSIFITSNVMHLLFGDVVALRVNPVTGTFIAAICTMALTHYITNSGIVAICAACRTDQPIWQTWNKHYLWSSITYFTGAIASGVTAVLIHLIGTYAFVITLPIIGILFLTYRTYLRNVEASCHSGRPG